MIKYRVIEVSNNDKSIGLKVGDLVRCSNKEAHLPIKMCLLPYRLRGKGHSGNRNSNHRNQWAFACVSLKELHNKEV